MGAVSVRRMGSDFIVTDDDGSVRRAVATQGDLWIVQRNVPDSSGSASGGAGGGSGDLQLGPIPSTLTAKTKDGTTVTLNGTQLNNAGSIISAAARNTRVGRKGALISLMAALTESSLLMYANSNVPESLSYPHDAVGSDHDSLGFFQMRPSTGWGSVRNLMNADYDARAFFGGASGPNYPSPRGMLDINGWQTMDPGVVCQAVEVSAFPDMYQNYQPVAQAILDALTVKDTPGTIPPSSGARFIWPFPLSVVTSEYGMRNGRLHAGMDFSGGPAVAGATIPASANGTVYGTFVTGTHGGYGNCVILSHGGGLYTLYAHMQDNSFMVRKGQTVHQGDGLGKLGNTGNSYGAHLHFETHQGGYRWNASSVNPRVFIPYWNARS